MPKNKYNTSYDSILELFIRIIIIGKYNNVSNKRLTKTLNTKAIIDRTFKN